MPVSREARLAADERALKAVQLRHEEHLDFAEIAKRIGLTSAQGAHEAYKRGVRDLIPAEKVAEERTASLARLDLYAQRAEQLFATDYALVSWGSKIEGETDPAPKFAALNLLLKIETLRERIVGFAAPRKSTVNVVTESMVDAEIKRLEQQLKDEAGDEPVPSPSTNGHPG